VERFDRQDREDAGHEIEKDAASQRAEQGEQQRSAPDLADGLAVTGHWARSRFERQAATVAQGEDAAHPGRSAALANEVGDEPVATAAKGLRCGEVDRAVLSGEEVRRADGDAGGKRDGEADRRSLDREPRRGGNRSGQGAAPLVEPVAERCAAVADGQVERQKPMFGHAHFFGAGEPLRLGPDRDDAACPFRRGDPDEEGIVAVVDVVGDAREDQPGRDRVTQIAGGHSGGQLPGDGHRQSGVAGIEPITVPARRGVHDNGEVKRFAGDRARFGDEFGLNSIAAIGQTARRRRAADKRQSGEPQEEKTHHSTPLPGLHGVVEHPQFVAANINDDCVTPRTPIWARAGLTDLCGRPSLWRGNSPPIRNGTIMKKIALTALVLALGLAACTKKTETTVDNNTVTTENTVAVDTNTAMNGADNALDAAGNATANAAAGAANATANGMNATANAVANTAK
jgi:hypothetical protein